jgi:HEAT repeat protein
MTSVEAEVARGNGAAPADVAGGFDVFRDTPFDVARCRAAVHALAEAPDRARTAAAAREFVATEPADEVRAWGTNVLELVPDTATFDFLHDVLDRVRGPLERREAKYTRAYALKALAAIATPDQEARLDELLEERWSDDAEDLLPRALAAAIGTRRGSRAARERLDELFRLADGRFWWQFMLLRALRECPVQAALPDVLRLLRDERSYLEIRNSAIRVLGLLEPTAEAVRALGEVLVCNPNEYLRVDAAVALGQLRDPGARTDLVTGVTDSNAEVRARSAHALEQSVGLDAAVAEIVGAALEAPAKDDRLQLFVEALRLIDPDRRSSSEALTRHLAAEDRARAQRAEALLLELGGWSAVQRLSQRRMTLDQLDALLSSSEEVVQSTYRSTIRQAQINFYFALGVNVLVVAIGVALSVIALVHLVHTPEDISAWLLPGAGGVVGILVNLLFNNPRRNARDDLTTLINVNVLFLGYLRQLNEIDATFKHAYIEGRDFGAADMRETVERIEESVTRTLALTGTHLRGGGDGGGAAASSG